MPAAAIILASPHPPTLGRWRKPWDITAPQLSELKKRIWSQFIVNNPKLWQSWVLNFLCFTVTSTCLDIHAPQTGYEPCQWSLYFKWENDNSHLGIIIIKNMIVRWQVLDDVQWVEEQQEVERKILYINNQTKWCVSCLLTLFLYTNKDHSQPLSCQWPAKHYSYNVFSRWMRIRSTMMMVFKDVDVRFNSRS